MTLRSPHQSDLLNKSISDLPVTLPLMNIKRSLAFKLNFNDKGERWMSRGFGSMSTWRTPSGLSPTLRDLSAPPPPFLILCLQPVLLLSPPAYRQQRVAMMPPVLLGSVLKNVSIPPPPSHGANINSLHEHVYT